MLINKENRSEALVKSLTELWYRSVNVSHLFLTEEDIEKLIPFVQMGLEAIEHLLVEYDGEEIVGFMGIEDQKLEMLFLDVLYMRKGYGKKLVLQAIKNFDVLYVDVNEDNPSAVEFYKKMGFTQYDRNELDDQGNHFPILKMKLNM